MAAVDTKRERVFVLAVPNLSATRIDSKWYNTQPLSEAEMEHFKLVTDLKQAMDLVNEAKKALSL